MARGDQQVKGAEGQANANSNKFMSNANDIYSTLEPDLKSQAANPQGFTPADQAAMETGAMQTAGGAESGAVGEGGLLAARTRNGGASTKAIADASRGAAENLSRNLLGIRTANATLKNQQRENAQAGLGNLAGLETGASNTALGLVAPLGRVNQEAGGNWNWETNLLDPFLSSAAGSLGAAAGSYIPTKGCWIAEAIYGADDPRTHLVRAWLNGPFRMTTFGNFVMAMYLTFGKSIAFFVRRFAPLRWMLKPLFDVALQKAEHWDRERQLFDARVLECRQYVPGSGVAVEVSIRGLL